MTRLTRNPFVRAVALFGALLLPALPWAAPAGAQTADATVEIDVVDGARLDYKFVVDGTWMEDPANPETVPDPYGGKNSVLTVK